MQIKNFARRYLLILTGLALIAVPLVQPLLYSEPAEAQGVTRFAGNTKSSPIALNADDTLLAVVNPDVNTVTLFDVSADRNLPLGEFPVGNEPNGVAVTPDGKFVYVANTIDGTVTVLAVDVAASPVATEIATLVVGTEPYGIAMPTVPAAAVVFRDSYSGV